MMPLLKQEELCVLRHKSNAWGFEAFLNNGLSCFLDSQNKQHIAQAMKLLNMLEGCIPKWHTRMIAYTFVLPHEQEKSIGVLATLTMHLPMGTQFTP